MLRTDARDWLSWSLLGMAASAMIAFLAYRASLAAAPDFEAILVGCTAGRLPGSPWSGIGGALLLASAVAALAPSRPRARMAAVLAATCGPLFFGSIEGWMSFSALTLQLMALVAFSRGLRRSSWILAVVAAWVWPPATLIVAALAVGEIDRARHAGAPWTSALLGSAGALTFAAAFALPAWVMRTDSYLPVLEERGMAAIARTAGLWTAAWPDEVTAGSWTTPVLSTVLGVAGLIVLGLLSTLGLVRVLQRARESEQYATIRLALGLALWTLVLTGLLGLGRGSWGSTQAMLHVCTVLLLVEGAFELRALPSMRAVGTTVAVLALLGWSAGLYHVATLWAQSSPFLH